MALTLEVDDYLPSLTNFERAEAPQPPSPEVSSYAARVDRDAQAAARIADTVKRLAAEVEAAIPRLRKAAEETLQAAGGVEAVEKAIKELEFREASAARHALAQSKQCQNDQQLLENIRSQGKKIKYQTISVYASDMLESCRQAEDAFLRVPEALRDARINLTLLLAETLNRTAGVEIRSDSDLDDFFS